MGVLGGGPTGRPAANSLILLSSISHTPAVNFSLSSGDDDDGFATFFDPAQAAGQEFARFFYPRPQGICGAKIAALFASPEAQFLSTTRDLPL